MLLWRCCQSAPNCQRLSSHSNPATADQISNQIQITISAPVWSHQIPSLQDSLQPFFESRWCHAFCNLLAWTVKETWIIISKTNLSLLLLLLVYSSWKDISFKTFVGFALSGAEVKFQANDAWKRLQKINRSAWERKGKANVETGGNQVKRILGAPKVSPNWSSGPLRFPA